MNIDAYKNHRSLEVINVIFEVWSLVQILPPSSWSSFALTTFQALFRWKDPKAFVLCWTKCSDYSWKATRSVATYIFFVFCLFAGAQGSASISPPLYPFTMLWSFFSCWPTSVWPPSWIQEYFLEVRSTSAQEEFCEALMMTWKSFDLRICISVFQTQCITFQEPGDHEWIGVTKIKSNVLATAVVLECLLENENLETLSDIFEKQPSSNGVPWVLDNNFHPWPLLL